MTQLTFDELFTYERLSRAYHDVLKHKRNRLRVFRFMLRAPVELRRLWQELHDRAYVPRPCRRFLIWCTAGQKIRIIHAPAFRDLIVQYCLYDYLNDLIDPHLIFDTYGCRRGKGTHKAADRVQQFVRQAPQGSYFLKIDIRHYYYNIRHDLLEQTLSRYIEDPELVRACMLFTDQTQPVGLDVGSTLAQLYGLVFLSRFDHYCKRVLKVKRYARYVDDIVFVGVTRAQAHDLLRHTEQWLKAALDLTLSHYTIAPLKQGINFTGYRTWRSYRLIRRRSRHTFRRALHALNWQSLESCLAHAEHTGSYRHLISQVANLQIFLPKHIYRRVKKWRGSAVA